MRTKPLAMSLLLLFISACGGGGSGDGGENRIFTLSADRQTIELTAQQDRDFSVAGPIGTVLLTVTPTPPNGLVAFTSHAPDSAIDFSNIFSLNESQAEVRVQFHSPNNLPPGTYTDTVRVDVCSDDECNDPIQGSPFIISTSYTVLEADDPEPNSPATSSSWLDLGANGLAFNPADGYIYASISATSPQAEYRNEIVAIDPATKSIVAHAFAGSEPVEVAISDDGTKLYVGFNGASQIKRFSLPALTNDLTIDIPPKTESNNRQTTLFATDISVAPGLPTTFAVVLSNQTTSTPAEDVVVFDGSTPRTNKLSDIREGFHQGPRSIAYSTGPNFLYGDEFSVMRIDAGGFVSQTIYDDLAQGFDVDIYSDNGLVYTDSGQVLNPDNGQLAGTYPIEARFNSVRPDFAIEPNNDKTYAIYRDSDEVSNYITLRIFNKERFTALDTFAVKVAEFDEDIRFINHEPLVVDGNGGLAFIFSDSSTSPPAVTGRVVFIDPLNLR